MKAIRFIALGLCLCLISACNDEAKTTNNPDGPSANDPIVSVRLTITPNEPVVATGSEIEFAWSAIARSGQRYNNLAGMLTSS